MRSTTFFIASALITAATAATYSYDCHNTNFPADDSWADEVTFENTAKQDMRLAGNQDWEINNLLETIYSIAKYTIGIDKRFALAIMMRESTGNTIIPCGDHGVSCGVYQVKDGDVAPNTHVPSCYSHPCPKETTDKMIQCGLLGCDNKYSNVNDCWRQYAPNYAATARCFNGGLWSVVTSDYAQGGGTPSYVQDIGNIMIGASSGSTQYQWEAIEPEMKCENYDQTTVTRMDDDDVKCMLAGKGLKNELVKLEVVKEILSQKEALKKQVSQQMPLEQDPPTTLDAAAETTAYA